jgi:hypothetical protein
MKYRSLLLHTCWSIYFWLIEFKLVFEFCLNSFFKNGKPFLLSFMFVAQPTHHPPKSGRAPSASSPVHLRTPVSPQPGSLAAQLRARRPLPLTGGSRRHSRPEPPLRAPLAAGPHAKEPPASIEPTASHRATPFA